jgi:hypothetical protein
METRPTRPTIAVGLKMEESNLRDVMANVEAAKEKTVKEVMMDFIFDCLGILFWTQVVESGKLFYGRRTKGDR